VLGTPVPVDPGKHTIEASAKGKKTFSTALEVSERTKTPSVEIPDLDADESQKVTPTPKAEPDKPQSSSGGTQRTIGIVAVSLGVVGLGVGTYFGLSTSSKWADAKTHCSGLECDRTGVDLAEQAKSAGNISTIAFIAGGVLVAGGAVLYFTAPRGKTTAIGVGPGSLLVRGSF
jgi:predicted sugar kinase